MNDQNALTLTLEHDANKSLKGGKRVYMDEDNHRIYLSGDEVEKLGSPSAVEVEIRPR